MSPADGKRLARSYFPAQEEGVATPFELYRDLYTAECAGSGGQRYLAVDYVPAAGDERDNPVDFDSFLLRGDMGLHIYDFNFVLGDLIDLARDKFASGSWPGDDPAR